jgi:hypothetical protein
VGALLLVGGLTPAAASTPVSLNVASNTRTFVVHVGAPIKLTLISTYWTVAKVAPGGAVRQVGEPAVFPGVINGPGCMVGQGCGTVTVHYKAVRTGVIRLSASRHTCGEAMACQPSQSHWWAEIKVIK